MSIHPIIPTLMKTPLLLTLLACGWNAAAEPVAVTSPDGKLILKLQPAENGRLLHSLEADGRLLIDPSPLGFAGGRPAGVTRRGHNSEWRPLWGKRAVVPDRFREATLDLTSYRVIARAYDDGVAFRYEFPQDFKGGDEQTAFHFSGDFTAWFYNGEQANIGPEKLSASHGRRLPVMTVEAGEHSFLAIHEADLRAGEPLILESNKGETSFRIASKPSEAWRVILFGRTPGSMVDSHLIELLNPPPAPDLDFSWVKPGVAVWDWRINGAQVDGFTYGMSLPSWKRMVDFAAENRMRHLVLDADWYGPEFGKDSDPVKGGKVAQVREIIAYGKIKGVGVWLYLNDVGGRNYPLEQTLKQYGDWGAAGVKYGFMKGSPGEKNQRTRLITELCARNKLLCDFHDGPVHPYGQMRTWPNAVTREFCHAQLDAHRVFTPRTFVTTVFVNMLAGPIDMNNGLADLTQAGRVDQASPVPSTLTGEAARTLIVFSGATIIPDIPENYRKRPELLEFLAAQQMPWRESRTLGGRIGEHIVMARQAADGTWLVGAATNEEPREIDIPLDFLPAGKFHALVIEDGADSDYRTHRESYQPARRTVTRTDRIRVKLAPGGGACAILKGDSNR
jgi:alpha-glucosidase